jgi:hypothetical protein
MAQLFRVDRRRASHRACDRSRGRLGTAPVTQLHSRLPDPPDRQGVQCPTDSVILLARSCQGWPPTLAAWGDDSARPAWALFAWWWLGGFCFAGTFIAVLTLAAVLGSMPFLVFLGIAVLGAIVGLLVRFGIAQAIVLIAEGLGWDVKRRSSRLGRLVQCLDQLIDQAGQLTTPRVTE